MKQLYIKPENRESLAKQIADKIYHQLNHHSLTSVEVPINLPEVNLPRPNLEFTKDAYLGIQALVSGTDNEVAWNGSVEKIVEDESVTYKITDVYTFPQVVTGATVRPDGDKEAIWLSELIMRDPDKFCKRRYHGHSHVNMQVNPSGTDIDHRDRYVKDVADDDFWIFTIHNKQQAMSVQIFDKADNVIYETEDINLIMPQELKIGDKTLKEFSEEQMQLVNNAYTATISGSNYWRTNKTEPETKFVSRSDIEDPMQLSVVDDTPENTNENEFDEDHLYARYNEFVEREGEGEVLSFYEWLNMPNREE